MARAQEWAARLPLVNALLAALLVCLCSPQAAAFDTQLSLVLPWAEPPGDQRAPTAVFGGTDIGSQVAVAVADLTSAGWEVRGLSVAPSGALSPLWNATLPLGAGIPSAVAVAGELAVLHLDGRLLALHPANGSLAWNATSPCSLGNPRLVNARAATDAVYLACAELSGDTTLLALRPGDGATAWALSSSSVAAALAPVRAAAAAPGILVYADTGSRLTAVGAASGALLWQVDVARWALPSGELGSQQGSSVTHLEIAGDTLLVREYAAGLGFAAGPFSYLALRLQHAQRPTLLWASNTTAGRDRLPPGFTDASPIVPPALSDDGQLFFYWSAAALAPQPPAPPAASPAPAPAPAPAAAPSPGALEPLWKPEDSTTALSGAAAAPSRRRLQQGPTRAAAPSPAPAATAPPAPALGGNLTAAVEAAADAAEAAAAAEAVLAAAVAPQTQGVGVVPPEGVVPTAVLKARRVATGEEAWRVQLAPVSAPAAAAGSLAVVTPEGLQVLDAATGAALWSVPQPPLGIYSYTPTLLAGGEAAALHNCLDLLASNSLCVYARAAREAGAAGGEGPASGGAAAIGGLPALGWWLPALGGRALAVVLAGATATFFLLF